MIKYSREAEKFILSQGKTAALRLYRAIEQLPLGDVKLLRGKKSPQLYRLRVGDYRVILIMMIVSLIFGMGHAITKTYFILSFLVSIYFCLIFQSTNNLLLPILAHAFYDFFVFIILYRTCRH